MECTNIGKEIPISNFEVLQLLRECPILPKERRPKSKGNENFATIRFEVLGYLKNTACQNQSEEIIKKFMRAMKPYKNSLSKQELLSMLNLRPTNPVEISYMTDEERVSEETLPELLRIVAECLPPAPDS